MIQAGSGSGNETITCGGQKSGPARLGLTDYRVLLNR